jgi:O-antigen/teichoic acid export membrane protein
MSTSDHLLRHSILLMAASQISNVSSLLFHMIMGRWLLPAEYGILASMLGVVLIAGMPLSAVNNSLAFFSAQLLQQKRAGDIFPLMRIWAWKLLLVAIPVLAAGILFSNPLALFFQLPARNVIILTLAVLALSFLMPIFSGALQGIQAFGWAAISGACWGVIRLVAGGALVYFVAAVAHSALVGQGLGVIASAAVGMTGLWIVLKGAPASDQPLPGTHSYFLSTLLVLACFAFIMNADILIVKHYFTPDQSGLFARAGTIGRTIIFLPMPIAMALFPKSVSNGAMSDQHGKLLGKSLFYTALIIVPGILFCTIYPQVPLGILYHDWAPTTSMCRLLRCTIWAMTPLSLAYIIMNFELAQNRFLITMPLVMCVAGYLAGVMIWHTSVFQIVAMLATVSALTLLALALCLPRRGKKCRG